MRQLIVSWAKRIHAALGTPVLVVIILMTAFFMYRTGESWYIERQLEKSGQKLEELSRRTAAQQVENERLAVEAEKQSGLTKVLLAGLDGITVQVSQLSESSRIIGIKVDGLRGNYESAKTQKRSAGTRSDLGIDERERRVLSSDNELYPDKPDDQ